MAKVAIVVLADTETHEGLGRVVNTLEAVKEFKDAHEEVSLSLMASARSGFRNCRSWTTRSMVCLWR
jgi:hypothetical protein